VLELAPALDPKAAAWPQHSEGLRQVSFMNDPAQPKAALGAAEGGAWRSRRRRLAQPKAALGAAEGGAKKVCLGFILTIESNLATENNPLPGFILPRRFGYKPCIVGVGSARRTRSKGLLTPKNPGGPPPRLDHCGRTAHRGSTKTPRSSPPEGDSYNA